MCCSFFSLDSAYAKNFTRSFPLMASFNFLAVIDLDFLSESAIVADASASFAASIALVRALLGKLLRTFLFSSSHCTGFILRPVLINLDWRS